MRRGRGRKRDTNGYQLVEVCTQAPELRRQKGKAQFDLQRVTLDRVVSKSRAVAPRTDHRST